MAETPFAEIQSGARPVATSYLCCPVRRCHWELHMHPDAPRSEAYDELTRHGRMHHGMPIPMLLDRAKEVTRDDPIG